VAQQVDLTKSSLPPFVKKGDFLNQSSDPRSRYETRNL
jgi:hypothetical protein